MWILDIEVVANSSSISGDVMLMMDEETLTYLMFVLESYRICRWKINKACRLLSIPVREREKRYSHNERLLNMHGPAQGCSPMRSRPNLAYFFEEEFVHLPLPLMDHRTLSPPV